LPRCRRAPRSASRPLHDALPIEIKAAGYDKLGAFVSSSGTGGTISGAGRRMKETDPNIRVVLADPVGSSIASWINTGVLGPDGPDRKSTRLNSRHVKSSYAVVRF